MRKKINKINTSLRLSFYQTSKNLKSLVLIFMLVFTVMCATAQTVVIQNVTPSGCYYYSGASKTTYSVQVGWTGANSNDIITVKIDGNNATQRIINVEDMYDPGSGSAVAGPIITPQVVAFEINADGASHTISAVMSGAHSFTATTVSATAPVACIPMACTGSNLGGMTYYDNNANGTHDAGEIKGIPGITVKAYDKNGTLYTATSDNDGRYAFSAANSNAIASTNFPVRLEFTNWPVYVQGYAGPSVSGNTSSVRFVASPTCNIDCGGVNPLSYSQSNPPVFSSLYTNGNPLGGGNAGTTAAIIQHAYNNYTDRSITTIATSAQVGSVWAHAWNKYKKRLFSAAFLKRHVGLGPLGLGGIYTVDYSTPASPVVSNFIDVTTIGINVGSVGTNTARGLNATKTNPNGDGTTFNLIGKVGIGGMDLSDDGNTLFIMNLSDKKVYAIDLTAYNNTGTIPTAANVTVITVPNPGCTGGTYRPFALKIYENILYAGMVCDAESSGNKSNLTASIKAYNLATSTWSDVFSFPLTYPKGYPSAGMPSITGWYPWTGNVSDVYNDGSLILRPTPVLTDIEFDLDGAMTLAFFDRIGHQMGNYNYDNATFNGGGAQTDAGGDVLRAYYSNGAYVLENNAKAGPTTGYAPGNNQGPGFGEFYHDDFDVVGGYHTEMATGGLTVVPGSGQIMIGMVDPSVFRGGDIWANGIRVNSSLNGVQLYGKSYYSDAGISSFGKANGMGDIEIASDNISFLEIGNYVWKDLDINGIQDPAEKGVAGIVMRMYKASDGTQVATATTDANGNYYFSTLNGQTILPSTNYKILAGVGQYSNTDSTILVNGIKYKITLSNIGQGANANLNDNDFSVSALSTALGAMPAGVPFINITTGSTGYVNHSIDLGIYALPGLGDTVWYDNNKNGLQNAEPPVQNLKVYLLNGAGVRIDSTTTNTNGYYQFVNLMPNTIYQVEFTSPGLIYTPTLQNVGTNDSLDSDIDGSLKTQQVTLSYNEFNNKLDAGFYACSKPNAGINQTACGGTCTNITGTTPNTGLWTAMGTNPTGATLGTTTSGIANVCFTNNSSGTFNFIYSTGGCSDTMSVIVSSKPNAGSNQSVCTNTTATMNASGSGTWTAQAGNPASATITTPNSPTTTISALSVIGNYNFIWTNNGCMDTVTITVNSSSTSSFTINNNNQCLESNSFAFTNTSAGATSYAWNFGDGSTSTATNPTHTYAAVGTYTVTLVASNASGCTATNTNTVTVYGNLTSGGTIGNDEAKCGSYDPDNIVNLVAPSGGSGTIEYIWLSNSVNVPNNGSNGWVVIPGANGPTYNPGTITQSTYYIRCARRDGCSSFVGESNIVSKIVNGFPTSGFTINNAIQCSSNNNFIFTNTSTGAVSYLWSFGDGTTSTAVNPTKHYNTNGNFTVKLIITNASGCKDSTTKYVFSGNPTAAFTYIKKCNGEVEFTNTSINATDYEWIFGNGSYCTNTLTPFTHTFYAGSNNTSRTYTVKLIARNNGMCSDTVTHTFTIDPSPVAIFSYDAIGCTRKVNFNNWSVNSTSYNWDFGVAGTNTDVSTATNPSYTYAADGVYVVTLIAKNAEGCADTLTKTVTVNSTGILPTASFGYLLNSGTCVTSYTFYSTSTNAVSVQWIFSDGAVVNSNSTTHSFANAGNYVVKLVAKSSTNCYDTISQTINIATSTSGALASFTINKAKQCFVGNSFNFINTSVFVGGGASYISSYQWDFGDGTTNNTNTFVYNKHYAAAGIYTVKLTATGSNGCRDFYYSTVEVLPSPNASFTAITHCGMDASITNNSTGAISYLWAYGDGGFEENNTTAFTHHYTRQDWYFIKLYAIGANGCIDSTDNGINTTKAGVPIISVKYDTITCNNAIRFINSTMGGSEFTWDFGDGSPLGHDYYATHAYATAGVYTVTLTAQNGNSCRSTYSFIVYAPQGWNLALPKAKFAYTISACSNIITATDSSLNFTGRAWKFDGVLVGNNASVTIPGASAGLHTLQLIVSNGTCADTLSQEVLIQNAPSGNITHQASTCSRTVLFTSNTSNANSFVWHFADVASGAADSATGSIASHTFTANATYIVSLTVNNLAGCVYKLYDTVNVNTNSNPIDASFKFNNTNCDCYCSNKITFTNTSTSGVNTYLWNFGDGNTSTQVNPNKGYATSGVFNVSLTVTNASGCASVATSQVYVPATAKGPSASFTTDNQTQCLSNNNFNFYNHSGYLGAGWVHRYYWSFGDGTFDTTNTFVFNKRYTNAGTYTVRLVAVGNEECFDTMTMTVNVRAGMCNSSSQVSVFAANKDAAYGATKNESTTGVNNVAITAAQAYTLYPNPNAGNFYIASKNISNFTSITVIDILGRNIPVYAKVNHAENRIEMSLDNVQSGNYFVIINNNNGFTDKLKFNVTY